MNHDRLCIEGTPSSDGSPLQYKIVLFVRMTKGNQSRMNRLQTVCALIISSHNETFSQRKSCQRKFYDSLEKFSHHRFCKRSVIFENSCRQKINKNRKTTNTYQGMGPTSRKELQHGAYSDDRDIGTSQCPQQSQARAFTQCFPSRCCDCVWKLVNAFTQNCVFEHFPKMFCKFLAVFLCRQPA